MRKFNTKRGFTLLELLVVLAVMSVVSTIGVTMFIKMTAIWGDTAAGMELNAKCVGIFDTMRQDMERVASAQRTGHSIQGIDRLETAQKINRHTPEDDQVVLPIHQRNIVDENWEQFGVMYHIDREGGVWGLMRTVGPNDGSIPANASQMVGDQVIAMNITYLDQDNVWHAEWSAAALPVAVRVSLTVGLSKRPGKHVSREAVFPIHVR